jgi:hypothetical protein
MEQATEVNYKDLEGKTVVFTVKNADETETVVEGIVEAASLAGIAFRQKGKSQLQLLEVGDVIRHEIVPEKPKVLKQRVLKPVELTKVRQHLADAHGINLNWLNSVSNEDAAEYHNSLNHNDPETGPLGHRHEEPKAKDGEASDLEKELAD